MMQREMRRGMRTHNDGLEGRVAEVTLTRRSPVFIDCWLRLSTRHRKRMTAGGYSGGVSSEVMEAMMSHGRGKQCDGGYRLTPPSAAEVVGSGGDGVDGRLD